MSDLEVSSLVQKCVQTRTYWKAGTSRKWNLVFEIQNWSKLKERAQRVDNKKEVIRLVMFTLIVMVIKMSNVTDFMYYLLDTAKYKFQFGQDI